MAEPPLSPGSLPPPVDLDDLLQPFAGRGIKLGLDRMQAALADGGNPERRFAAVQVAGTNGKGSIATQLHCILLAAGWRCGIYRSPHLVSWCERIQLDAAWIDADTLRADLGRWLAIAQRHGLSPFELFTAAAFDRFAAEGLPLVVLEVGVGGRLDATTAHPHRQVVGFGPIGMDHCDLLGDNLAAIAREKAAVMAGARVAISGPQAPEVAQVLHQEARRWDCSLRWVEPLASAAQGGPRLGLAGNLQRSNAAVAVAMAEALHALGWTLSPQAIQRGLAAARWPGRLERRQFRGFPLLLDGAHNPPGAQALRDELDRLQAEAEAEAEAGLGICHGSGDDSAGGSGSGSYLGPRRWLLGMQITKDAPQLLDALLRPGDQVALVPVPDLPSWSRAELVAARPLLAPQLSEVASPCEGLEWLGASPGPLPGVAGSLHLLGAVIPHLDAPATG
ncbi:MAG: bifunctional folylpolyglutamate synthase/dihydrofolate synthase [Cyanobacteriota bacterium]